MERIIRNWERLIGYIIFNGYYFGFYLIISSNRTYTIGENHAIIQKPYISYLYIWIWMGYTLILIGEYLLHRRIQQEEVTVLYYPKIKLEIIKIILILLSHIIFWVLVDSGINLTIVYFIIFFTLILTPTINNKAVFETKSYIICSGIKYYYDKIEDFKDDFGFKVRLKIGGKEITIPCGNEKKYDLVIDKLNKRISAG